MIVILSGSIGRLPYGGHAWIDMQYLAGLQQLGHEVYYLEECGAESWVYSWEEERLTTSLDYPAAYLRHCMQLLGLRDRWIYRAGEQAAGMLVDDFKEVCRRADLLLLRAVPLPLWRPEYSLPRRRAFVDADPGFTQISLVQGHAELAATVDRCERLFTIGQLIGTPGCQVPDAGREWVKTVPPISMLDWPFSVQGPATHFTSIMHWRGFREVEYDGVVYGQKDLEFPAYLEMPGRTGQAFKVALTGAAPRLLEEHGWEVQEGWRATRTPELYRGFIQESRAEFGVAKQGYVRMRSGWISDRTICYLASGRPALVEETGISAWLPTGEGLLMFSNIDEAVAGVEAINAGYELHRHAARKLAAEVFAAERVLPALLQAAV